nr:hypothetical protein [Tanacetum cinerariifolium]
MELAVYDVERVESDGFWLVLQGIDFFREDKQYPRQVGRVLLDGEAVYDIIYEQCCLKLQKEVRERRKYVYTTLTGFFGDLNCHRRIKNDTIHNALRSLKLVKIKTQGHHVRVPRHKEMRTIQRLKESHSKGPLTLSECVNPEEKVVVNLKYPKLTVTIGRQLPMHFKQKLIKLLRDNVDVFV